MPQRNWVRYLLFVSLAGVVMGLILTLTPLITNSIGALYYDHYVGTGAYASLSTSELQVQRFAYGIAGALLASWLTLVAWLVHEPFRRGERWAWNAILVSTIVWFIGDGYVSIITGFPVHAALNLSLLVLIGIGLIATYRDFRRTA